jgi:hypothetical protein
MLTDLFIAREARLAARRVAGEMVILSADDSSLYVLNELGTLLWEAADGRTPLRQIVDHVVCTEFDVDAATGLQDAESFLRQLAGYGILHVSNTPIQPEGHDSPTPREVI